MEPKDTNKKPHKQKFLTCVTIVLAITLLLIAVLSYYLVFLYPEDQVSQLGITNATEKAGFINQYRTTSIQLVSTLAQILGGGAVLLGLYFAWGNLTTAREGQITERFTRAVDQLGSEKLEIRLGGIYALERIANESEKDYWPIMKIFAAYIRDKSPNDSRYFNSNLRDEDMADEQFKKMNRYEYWRYCIKKYSKISEDDFLNIFWQISAPIDVETVIHTIKERKFFHCYYKNLNDLNPCCGKEPRGLFLFNTNLCKVNLNEAHLEEATLSLSFICLGSFKKAHLKGANFNKSVLDSTNFVKADLEDAKFKNASLLFADLRETILTGANFTGASLMETNLTGAKNLTVDQLSKAKTLCKAKLDPELEKPLREKYPALFEKPDE